MSKKYPCLIFSHLSYLSFIITMLSFISTNHLKAETNTNKIVPLPDLNIRIDRGRHWHMKNFSNGVNNNKDDTPAIQNALNNLKEGDTLSFERRVYNTRGGMQIPQLSSVTILGNGAVINNKISHLPSIVLSVNSGWIDVPYIKVRSKITAGNDFVVVTNAHRLSVGKYIWISSNEAIGARDTSYKIGLYGKVKDIIQDTVFLNRKFDRNMTAEFSKLRVILNCENICIKDLIIETFHEKDIALKMDYCQKLSLINIKCLPKTFSSIGISVNANFNSKIDRCYTENFRDYNNILGYGFSISGDSISVSNSLSKGCKHNFTSANRSSISRFLTFSKCIAKESYLYSFDFHGSVVNSIFKNCTVTDSHGGFFLRGMSDLTIDSCYVYNVKDNAVLLRGDADSTMTNIKITRSRFNNTNITAGTATITKDTGTKLLNLLIYNCELQNGDRNAITLSQWPYTNNSTISNCYITHFGLGGISIGGSGNTIKNVHIDDFGKKQYGRGIELLFGGKTCIQKVVIIKRNKYDANAIRIDKATNRVWIKESKILNFETGSQIVVTNTSPQIVSY